MAVTDEHQRLVVQHPAGPRVQRGTTQGIVQVELPHQRRHELLLDVRPFEAAEAGSAADSGGLDSDDTADRRAEQRVAGGSGTHRASAARGDVRIISVGWTALLRHAPRAVVGAPSPDCPVMARWPPDTAPGVAPPEIRK